jgi:uncharacterized protein YjiS (DUF1127 family)|tara:strand:+ start:1145 stop:1327 length:183 start_codon:yes stop_codon:yes gene_type:complete
MLKRLFHKIIEARIESVKRKIARNQLYSMTDAELRDIGIGRYDIERVVRYGYKEANHYST